MIRIDEIYNNTFWPWLEQNRPGVRMFFCDPPGNTSPAALFNHGSDTIEENNYVFFHDQEPVDPELYSELFQEVQLRNIDITHKNGPEMPATHPVGHVIVSEKGENVKRLQDLYGWQPHYYFYHGWACQDWYRGYDRTYLIKRARDRAPTKTFMSPNRIVAGKRDHRVLFLYNVFKNQLENNHISAPRICQYENEDISVIAKKYNTQYPDIESVFNNADLPRLFADEEHQLMTSCWLSNFKEAADSLVYVPTETVYFGDRLHITEKTFKAIALEMPFVLVAPANSLEYMRSYGFKTFSPVLDESYDLELDPYKRIEKVTQLLKELNTLTVNERRQIHKHLLPRVEYNYNHFYKGGLTDILDTELNTMLSQLYRSLLT
jgi:hypothetical protein